MKPSEVLTKAKAIISDPLHWTQGESARTGTRRPVDSLSPEAVCFCTLGAVNKACEANRKEYEISTQILTRLVYKQGFRTDLNSNSGVISFNDLKGRRHAEVLELFDQAIQEAKNHEATRNP